VNTRRVAAAQAQAQGCAAVGADDLAVNGFGDPGAGRGRRLAEDLPSEARLVDRGKTSALKQAQDGAEIVVAVRADGPGYCGADAAGG
jgi:hypothetical protein